MSVTLKLLPYQQQWRALIAARLYQKQLLYVSTNCQNNKAVFPYTSCAVSVTNQHARISQSIACRGFHSSGHCRARFRRERKGSNSVDHEAQNKLFPSDNDPLTERLKSDSNALNVMARGTDADYSEDFSYISNSEREVDWSVQKHAVNLSNYLDDWEEEEEKNMDNVPQQPKTELVHKKDSKVIKASVDTLQPIITNMLEEIEKEKKGSEAEEIVDEFDLELAGRGDFDLSHVTKVEIPENITFADIVNDSDILKKLVMLGVDLSVLQEKDFGGVVLHMNFDRDIAPYVLFLRQSGVTEDAVGKVLTKCPEILKENLHNLNVRVDYLHSKKFTESQISHMISGNPQFLLVPVTEVDAKLGFIQREFNLTGAQLRKSVSGLPRLIYRDESILKEARFHMEKFLGFTKEETRLIFLNYPKVYYNNLNSLEVIFDYVHNVMDLPHPLIARTPQILNNTKHKTDTRHRFLLKCGRAQYDPTKENYVPLSAFYKLSDKDFVSDVAKALLSEYYEFMKCI